MWCHRFTSQHLFTPIIEAFEISPQGTIRLLLPFLKILKVRCHYEPYEYTKITPIRKVCLALPKFALPLLMEVLSDYCPVKSLGVVGHLDPKTAIPLLAKYLKNPQCDYSGRKN